PFRLFAALPPPAGCAGAFRAAPPVPPGGSGGPARRALGGETRSLALESPERRVRPDRSRPPGAPLSLRSRAGSAVKRSVFLLLGCAARRGPRPLRSTKKAVPKD